ncbi:Serine/threonine-protein kinase SRPK [Lachnellula cervina]|uniref:non-specific serine/threonine protein kinase n=1 Tax=Lachnellula cervina TaxID=1316786 RepID=A0A7D8Z3S9_9HELO|nr:Serine/threonine-protein kinase SRPK [Lachnellula cervina]
MSTLKPDQQEEGIDKYHKGGFHPVRLGEFYSSKYKVLRKLGYGRYSTVWLVRNQDDQRFWAMKVLSAECYGAGTDIFELEILRHLRNADIEHPGYKYISSLEDSFTHEGPNGSHVCLIFKVMGENLSTFRYWFGNGLILSPVAARFATQLLQALDYAHTCGVIHTDIQPNNIMVQVPDESLINRYLERTLSDTRELQLSPEDSAEYAIIPTQSLRDFYLPDDHFDVMTVDIALSDWGVASWTSKHLTELIQPVLLRSPEVMIEAPWGPSTDIWNLGALVPELIYGQSMFSGKTEAKVYNSTRHLEEMNRLLGPFPREMLLKGNTTLVKDTFDENGNIREPKMTSFVGLDVRYSNLEDDEKEEFTAFTKALLELNPDKRKSAKVLLEEAWLHHPWEGKVQA